MSGTVRWQLLTEVGVTVNGERAELTGQRQRAVVAYLALHAGEPVTNERLVDALWGAEPPKTARNSVQRFVADIRRALAGASERIVTLDAGYRLDLVGDDEVDVAVVEDRLRTARDLLDRGRAAEALDAIAEATSRLSGDPLAGLGDPDFATSARVRLEDLVIDAVELQLAGELDLGMYSQVAQEARVLVTRYPYREPLWGHLMAGLYGAGRQRDALAAAQELRVRLRDDLGVDPSEAIRDLEHRIVAQTLPLVTPTRSAESPAIAAGLSVPRTRFFGRSDELTTLQDLVLATGTPLVTIAGPGGSGKTRLAARLIEQVGGRFDDGVVGVELDAVSDAERVATTIAVACGLPGTDTDVHGSLAAHLADRSMLLILDNADDAVGPVGELCAGLLARAPNLRIVVTSRTVLGLAVEHVIDLGGLDLVAPDLRESTPAAALFTERAGRQQRGFEPDAYVDEICTLLGGLPLAIELAARWVSTMTTAQIASRLTEDLELLQTDSADVVARQRSMQRVLETSWSALHEDQQRQLSELALCVGGFDLEAAQAVAGVTPVELQRLVGASLLTRLTGGRFEMHELIRQFALSRLRADQGAAARTRYRDHYLGLLSGGFQRLVGADGSTLMTQLSTDFDNLAAAWHMAIDAEEREPLEAAGPALEIFSISTSRFVDSTTLFRRAAGIGPDHFAGRMLAHALATGWRGQTIEATRSAHDTAMALVSGPSPAEAQVRARLATDYAFAMNELSGESDLARQVLERGLEDATVAGDEHQRAMALLTLGRTSQTCGDFEDAERLLEASIDIFRSRGHLRGESSAVGILAAVHAEQYNIWAALEADLHHLDLRIQQGDQAATITAHANTGASFVLVGAWDEADRHSTIALEAARSTEDTRFVPYLICQLAEVRAGQGRLVEAEQLFSDGIAGCRADNFSLGLRLKLPEWGRFLIERQRFLEADLVLEEATTIWSEIGGDHYRLTADGTRARAVLGLGDPEGAAALAGATWQDVSARDAKGLPFPLRTMADCMLVFDAVDDHDQRNRVQTLGRATVRDVVAKFADPTYRRTFLDLPDVRLLTGSTTAGAE